MFIMIVNLLVIDHKSSVLMVSTGKYCGSLTRIRMLELWHSHDGETWGMVTNTMIQHLWWAKGRNHNDQPSSATLFNSRAIPKLNELLIFKPWLLICQQPPDLLAGDAFQNPNHSMVKSRCNLNLVGDTQQLMMLLVVPNHYEKHHRPPRRHRRSSCQNNCACRPAAERLHGLAEYLPGRK